MRKTSQDGGDTTSITSGIDNEIKKVGAGIMKSKKNSIKRKVQNFSHESDDAVIEPLLQKDKEKPETGSQSAKFMLSKTKTDSTSDKLSDKDKLLSDETAEKPSFSNAPAVSSLYTNNTKEIQATKTFASTTITQFHNHMNTNVFSAHDGVKDVAPKTQILVEIDGNKPTGYSPSPLIFTTAKIHTDGKTKHMEPVQVTPVPILSTIEGNVVKSGTVNTEKKSGLSDIMGNVYPKSGPSDVKTSDKDHSVPVSLTNPGLGNKVTGGDKSAKSTLVSNSVQTSTIADISTCKAPSSVSTVKSNFVTSTTKPVEKTKFKDEPAKTTQSTMPKALTAESNKVNVPITTITSEIVKPGKSLGSSTEYSNVKSDIAKIDISKGSAKELPVTSVSEEIKVDVNKNVQLTSRLGSQQPETFNVPKSTVNTKGATDLSNKVNTKPASSTLANKQLPRQKGAITEDVIDPSAAVKKSSLGQSIPSSTSVESKDTSNQLPLMNKSQPKSVNSDVTKPSTMKSNANNVTVHSSKTTASSINIKSPTSTQSVAPAKAVVTSANSADVTKPTFKSPIPANSKKPTGPTLPSTTASTQSASTIKPSIPSPVVETKTVASKPETTKPTTTSSIANNVNKSQTANTKPSSIVPTSSVKTTTVPLVSTVKPVKPEMGSSQSKQITSPVTTAGKLPVTTSSNSNVTATAKTPGASVKSTTATVSSADSSSKLPTTKKQATEKSAPVSSKPSTTTSVVTPVTSAVTTKPTVSNKQNESITSKLSKEGKSSKA